MSMDWFRWWHGSVIDPKFRIVARKAGVPVAAVLGVWAALLEYASQQDERGSLAGLDLEDTAEVLGLDEATIQAIMECMTAKGLLTRSPSIAAWSRRQPKREDDSTERVRAYRERQKAPDTLPGNAAVTRCNASATPPNAEATLRNASDTDTEKTREEKTREEKDRREIDMDAVTEEGTGVLERVEAHTAPASRNAPPSADATPPCKPQLAEPKQTAARATRLPPDFTVPPEWLAWAAQARPSIDVRLEADKFCDYWKAASGRTATKHDWQATWRNWIRNAHPPRAHSGRPPGKALTVTEHNAAALQEWLAMKEREVAETGYAPH